MVWFENKEDREQVSNFLKTKTCLSYIVGLSWEKNTGLTWINGANTDYAASNIAEMAFAQTCGSVGRSWPISAEKKLTFLCRMAPKG